MQNVQMPGAAAAIGRLMGMAAVGGGLIFAGMNCIFNVEGGHRAILFRRIGGIQDKVYTEGTHLMIPFFDRPIIYDVRARPHLVNSQSGSRDLQMVNIGLRVLTRPQANKLPEIYRSLGKDYSERVLPSIVQETLKSVIAQYNASQLLTMREGASKRRWLIGWEAVADAEEGALQQSCSMVSKDIRRILTQRAINFNIILEDVSITQLTFSKEYTGAVEAKQVAQQEAERAKFIVERAQQEKEGTIIRAQGEAQSAKMIGLAIQQNPAFLSLRKIEAAREIADTISNASNRVFLNSDSLLLNLAQIDIMGKK